jgi:hypothetical protein
MRVVHITAITGRVSVNRRGNDATGVSSSATASHNEVGVMHSRAQKSSDTIMNLSIFDY